MKTLVLFSCSLALIACAGEQRPADQASTAPPAKAEAPAPTMTSAATEPTTSAQASAQEQTIEVAGAFKPASVTIPANTPVRLHFRRSDQPTCAEEIVFPELNLRKKIAASQTVTFDIPAQQARTINFACGMDMLKGTVVVQ
jgi:plastocyanin domain-containing protein